MQDFPLYFELGFQHILDWQGYDHILFVSALCALYTFKNWSRVLWLVTAFTLGHSITLALSVLGQVKLPAAWIEFLIPVTIIATALFNIFNKSMSLQAARLAYGLALVFGLIHGLGFSNYLKSLLGSDTNIVGELLAFNLGLELGQVLIVTAVLSISWLALQVFRVLRREWSLVLSSMILGMALMMALSRLPF
ncbi:MAG: HupE/UreJ family protein [Adhaeribacter sp.]